MSSYPATPAARDRWIVARRGPRAPVDPRRPHAFFVEDECSATGEVVPVATIFLTNRECPWRCLMCDLWQHTLTASVSPGDIPAQIDFALEQLPAARQIKLYNSGSFFDRRAIPVEDYAAIAARVKPFDRVIVECHPALVGESSLDFQRLLPGRLEVAIGLETVHPEVLDRLNKRMTLDQFATAASFLKDHEIDLRAFILVQPPFLPASEALDWAERSLDLAFRCGATAATLIPTRGGNGALEVLNAEGSFSPPRLETLEAAVDYGLSLARGRVFSDVWDLRHCSGCEDCFAARVSRLREMNLTQRRMNPVICEHAA